MLSADKCSLQINADNYVKMTTTTSGLSRYDVKVKFSDCELEFIMDAITKPLQTKESRTLVSRDAYLFQQFIPTSSLAVTVSCSGSTELKSDGAVMLMHAYQSTKPHLCAQRWEFLSLQQPDFKKTKSQPDALLVCQFTTPSVKGGPSGTTVVQSVLVRNGEVKSLFTRNDLKVETTTKDAVSGYLIPEKVILQLEGQSLKSQPSTVKMNVQHREPTLRVDILGDLPYLLRKVLQAFIAKPFSFMFMEKEVSASCLADGEQFTLQGQLYHETTIVSNTD